MADCPPYATTESCPPTKTCKDRCTGKITTTTGSCPAGTETQNSVLLSSGQFAWKKSLLSIDSLGVGIWGLDLNYLAGALDGLLGKGFDWTQNARLEEMVNGDVDFFTSENTHERFVHLGGGVYSSEGNKTAAILTRSGSGASDEFTIISSSGITTKFFGFDGTITTPGRIKIITDRYGNQQTFSWQHVGDMDQLTTVTDGYGRQITYSYYGAEKGYRLREIEDFLGRKLYFQYDDAGHLTAVVTPSIEKAVEGNTFPGGTAYVFQYDTSNPRPDRRDDLIRIWYPNEATPSIDTATRTVNVANVYEQATPRYVIEYGQDPMDEDHYGKVVSETVGDPENGVGGTSTFLYTTADLPSNLIDPTDLILSRTVVTDRNGNQTIYDFNANDILVRKEVLANRSKNSLQASSFVTWSKYNAQNQLVAEVMPEGDSIEYTYEDGVVSGISGTYVKRRGLLLSETYKAGNSIGITSRAGSNGQSQLTRRYFYEPIYNRLCATIEHRGNPIDGGDTYFAPQNGGTTPTDEDRSRYATITYYDYQKNTDATIKNNAEVQALLGLTSTEIQSLIDHVDAQMTDGGISAGFERNLGDINGDGTGDGASSGLPAAKMLGNGVKIKHPSVRLVDTTSQARIELFTNNDRGQQTTRTDPEGNLTVIVRNPLNDPEGDGRFVSSTLSTKQYGRVKEIHVDADPDDVMTLVGEDGDLTDFIKNKITRTNTPGVYQDLVTRNAAPGSASGSGCGCGSCSYDSLGNVLAQTDPRGFTTRYDRDELGRVIRTIAPAPYLYRTETHYDANGNVIRVDVEDKVVDYSSDDPTDALYAKFTPTGNTAGGASTAHVPTKAGEGGSVRPGWFTSFFTYDLLDNKIAEDIDAAGSKPSSLITTYQYDGNQNLIRITKPEGNRVEYDYDERDLRIAQRVGYDPTNSVDGAVTVFVYDKNGNQIETIGPADRDAESDTNRTVIIEDAFRSSSPLTHTGDWLAENTYDGLNRLIETKDAIGNVTEFTHDPNNRIIQTLQQGPIGGSSPIDRDGTNNVDLSKSYARFDEAGRPYENQQDVFLASGTSLPSSRAVTHTGGGLATNSIANDHTGTVTLTSAGSSYVLNRSEYDRAGRTTKQIADNTGQTTFTYDGANRQLSQTDALDNAIENTYDANGNVIRVTRTEVCTITAPSVDDEVFESLMRYDALNRLVVVANQGADGSLSVDLTDDQTLFTLYGYDSRDQQTLLIDPKGNTSLSLFDGAGRMIETRQHLRQDGQGNNGPEANASFEAEGGASIRTLTVYDGNGRTIALIDDRGATTAYRYDTLDRQIEMQFADGAKRTNVYNDASDLTEYTDENGSDFIYDYDATGRKITCIVTKADGVLGTDSQNFEYDGLGRLTRSLDTISATSAEVETFFDSLSRMVEESQSYGGNTCNVTHYAFTSVLAMGFVFPDNRALTNTYDLLYRRTLVEETSGGADIAAWKFFGPNRIAEVTLANGLACTCMNNARTHSTVQEGFSNPAWGDVSSDRLGYDGAGRMIAKRYLASALNVSDGYDDTTALVGFTTEFDKISNKLFERHLHVENRSYLYKAMDSMDRLKEYQRGTLNSGGAMVVSAITLPGTDSQRSYDLDGLGNWRRTSFTPVGGSATTEVRQHNLLNQITKRASTSLSYDDNGNLTDDGALLLEYDAFNRLKRVKNKSNNQTMGEYTYDAMGRRIRKVVTNSGITGTIPNGTTDYLYSGWQVIEERDGSNDHTKQFVWGLYIDELIQQKTYVTTGGGNLTASEYYPLQDLHYRVTALTDSSGNVMESYDYDPYGKRLIYSDDGADTTWFTADDITTENASCGYGHQGLMHDEESALIYSRSRHIIPMLGRFLQRSSLLYMNEMSLYQYVLSAPAQGLDPTGSGTRSTTNSSTQPTTQQDGGCNCDQPPVEMPPGKDLVIDIKRMIVNLRGENTSGLCGWIRPGTIENCKATVTFKEGTLFGCAIAKGLIPKDQKLCTYVERLIRQHKEEEEKQGKRLAQTLECPEGKHCCNKKTFNGRYPAQVSVVAVFRDNIQNKDACTVTISGSADLTAEGEVGECK